MRVEEVSMRRISSVIGAGVLVFAMSSTGKAQSSPLQAEDRGGPRYTTGDTMGQAGAQSGASNADVANEPRLGRDRAAKKTARERPLKAESGTPGMGHRGTETSEGGAGTTGGSGPGAARTGH
jgi:hypothetical protein